MKKLSAILLTGIFAFSQYARQLSWLECKFSNSFKTESSKCDCEKQAGFDKQGDDPSPVSKAHTHIHPDEFFAAVNKVYIDPYSGIAMSHPAELYSADTCAGAEREPWQPPNT